MEKREFESAMGPGFLLARDLCNLCRRQLRSVMEWKSGILP